MYNTPLISVIIPIYNVEKYLNECVDSVLQQTYSKLEIILVNDGSPDNCGPICEDYAKQDTRIVVMHKENGGLSDARNAGLDICKGEYISFIDSDDFVHPQFIEILYQNLLEHDADISFCDYVRFKKNDKLNTNYENPLQIKIFEGNQMITNLYDSNWYPKNVVVWNKVYKKEVFKGIRYAKGFNHEDELIFTDLYSKDFKVVYTSKKLLYYRIREESIMSNIYSLTNLQSKKELYSKRKLFFADQYSELQKYNRIKYSYYIASGMLNSNAKLFKPFLNAEIIKYVLGNKELHWKSKILFIVKLLKP